MTDIDISPEAVSSLIDEYGIAMRDCGREDMSFTSASGKYYRETCDGTRAELNAAINALRSTLTESLSALDAVIAERDAAYAEVDAVKQSLTAASGNALFDALAGRLVRHIMDAEVDCDPPTDIELRLVAIIRERDSLRLALTASENRVAELVAKYETEDPITPTAHELETWRGNEPAAAVRMYRTRLNCGLRQAVDAMKGANGEL